jgi:hypothetical protein
VAGGNRTAWERRCSGHLGFILRDLISFPAHLISVTPADLTRANRLTTSSVSRPPTPLSGSDYYCPKPVLAPVSEGEVFSFLFGIQHARRSTTFFGWFHLIFLFSRSFSTRGHACCWPDAWHEVKIRFWSSMAWHLGHSARSARVVFGANLLWVRASFASLPRKANSFSVFRCFVLSAVQMVSSVGLLPRVFSPPLLCHRGFASFAF